MLTTTIILLVLTLASAVVGFRDLLPPVTRVFELLFWVFGVLFVLFLNLTLLRKVWPRAAGDEPGPGEPGS